MDFIVELDGVRLDRYIRRVFSKIKQSTLEISLRNKLIKLNNMNATSNTRLKCGDVVYIADKLLNNNIKIIEQKKVQKFVSSLLLYEDDHIMVINKPYGIAVQGGKKITTSINSLIGDNYVVHRLDQHTTGILIIAKDLQTVKLIGEKFKNKTIIKKYLALISGKPNNDYGKIQSKLEKKCVNGKELMVSTNSATGKLALTEFQVIKRFDFANVAYIELTPKTGRKHQLRVHMNDIQCPILSDGKYGGKSAFIDNMVKKLNLHAHSVEFDLYGKNITITAPLPEHIVQNLEYLERSVIQKKL